MVPRKLFAPFLGASVPDAHLPAAMFVPVPEPAGSLTLTKL